MCMCVCMCVRMHGCVCVCARARESATGALEIKVVADKRSVVEVHVEGEAADKV